MKRDSAKDYAIDVIYEAWLRDYDIPNDVVHRSELLITTEEKFVDYSCKKANTTPKGLQLYIRKLENPTEKDLQVGTILLDVV